MSVTVPGVEQSLTAGNRGNTDTEVFRDRVLAGLAAAGSSAVPASRSADGSVWQGWAVEVVANTGSTNTDLMERVRQEICHGFTALITLDQSAGKGRLTRVWSAPRGTSLFMSMALPLIGDSEWWGLMPLVTGLAVANAINGLPGAGGELAWLKWPNDVQVNGRKICGILVEATAGIAVAGAGVNVCQTADQIGHPGAISLAMAGVHASRENVAVAIITEMTNLWPRLATDEGRATLRADYQAVCSTIDRPIRLFFDDQTVIDGRAVGIADDGRLLVDVDGEVRAFASGEVFHVRPGQG